MLEEGQLIISTPEKWDALSCRWKQRKHVQQVSFSIVDELHLIGDKGGSVLEVIVSRMRYISSRVENKIRIVALSTSLANAKDLAMTKPMYTAIVQHAREGKPAIVFVPMRKHARLAALESFMERINEPVLKETLTCGVGYLHEGLSGTDQDIVKTLFETGWIQVCVISSKMCWGVPLSVHLVVVMGTQCHNGKKNVQSEYPHNLHDNFNAEVVVGVIQNKQGAAEYLTWTFMYRRLTQNPNYYNLQGVSHRHISDHLSELVEYTISELESSKCITVVDEVLLSPLNLGRIASYYYVSYTTIELFSSSLTSKTKLKGLLEILASASEYEQLPIRSGEEELIKRLVNHQRFTFGNPRYTDPYVKANVLLQAHFSRQMVGGNLASDQQEVFLSPSRVLQAMVDVISSNGWLNLALLAMEVTQMLTQGMWERDSRLLQLPHITKELAKKCQENPGKSIESVFDLLEMEEDERHELLQMSEAQLMDIARFCSWFPDIGLTYDVLDGSNVRAGNDVTLQATLERNLEGRTEVGPVFAPRYPKDKEEGWWLVVGDIKSNQLVAIKRVNLQRKSRINLDFTAPAEAGTRTFKLFHV
ncbi:hypothetical protein RND71_006343 [Anisodus tanguticus]|uniref:Helicase ATP-binding domain-containing protein n=1 Tax=Anisodus tanguticus TaxID=243964 RepID=A0AAE1SVX5_9SOLA|nr:hypothetical protein RND71_006343 [Anisodus tanguticus]